LLNRRLIIVVSIVIGFIYNSLLSFELGEDASISEVYFRFSIESKVELNTLTRIVSIDNVIGTEVYAYANQKGLEKLKGLGYEIEVLPNPGTLIKPKMANTIEKMKDWDNYPTYETYISMMYQFATDYPGICMVENVGYSQEGREILFAKISDNVNIEENEPEFMYTAQIHGDELVTYIMMLRLIDYLLTNYGTDPEVTDLVDNIEIWINPLANPDGTYHGGNNTVYGAQRFLANGVDPNRNFPDPDDGPHPDGNPYAPETIIMMDFADAHSFVHSANFHSGAEVVNYPWDTWQKRHADNMWYQLISHAYADTVHANAPAGYMDGFDNGITNGYDWYTIAGGRQDYMNYWHGCKEVTIELSNDKFLSESQLSAHWNYNKRSFLNYIENVLYGIRGVVTDTYGNPLFAKITIIGHDFDNSEVFTDPDVGDYYRMCMPGTYDLLIESEGYYPKTIENVVVIEGQQTIASAQLTTLPNVPVLIYAGNTTTQVDPGDEVSFKIKVKNLGIATAYNTSGLLYINDPYVDVISGCSAFPIISPQNVELSNDYYQIEISSQCPENYYATFSLYLHCTGFDTIDVFEMPIGVNQILVFDLDKNANSAPSICTSLEKLNQEIIYATESLPDELSIFSAIFICLGVYGNNTALTEIYAVPFANYLDNGGRIYMEGGETWKYDLPTSLHPYFGIDGISDGSSDTYSIIGCDTTFMEGIAFNYQGDNRYMDHLSPLDNAYPIFYNQSPEYFNGIARSKNGYKTVGTSFEFGGVPAAFQDSVMLRYLEFFDIDTTTSGGIVCVPGDVNNDGYVNVADIVKIVQFILELDEPDDYEACAADWNSDGVINVQDIVGIIQYILNQ